MTDGSSQSDNSEQGAQVLSLLPWERSLRRAQAVDQAFDIATQPNRVAQATELDAYYAIKRRGLEDALPILGYLRNEQIRTLFDLELWKSDRIEVADFLSWLEGFRVAGREAVVRAASSLDVEALAAVLRRRLHVALVPKEDRSDDDPVPDWLVHPPQEIEPISQTPDGRFFIAARARDEQFELESTGDPVVEEEERKQILALVRELYLSEDWEFIAGALRLAQTDLTSSLEESAYNFRNHRIDDLGFSPRTRALEVYAPIDPSEVLSDNYPEDVAIDREARLPWLHTQTLSEGLLGQALGHLGPGLAERVEADLLALANNVLVADGIDPANMDEVRQALERTRGYLSMALAYQVSGDHLEDAVIRLESVHVSILHRSGYSLTLKLKERAQRLLSHPGAGGLGLAAYSSSDRWVLEALMASRPWYCVGLDHDSAFEDVRSFTSVEDLVRVEHFLGELEALVEMSEQREWFAASLPSDTLPNDAAERDLDRRLATGAAWMLLGQDFTVQPLMENDLLNLLDILGASPTSGQFEAADTVAVTLLGSGATDLSDTNGGLVARVKRVLDRLGQLLYPLVGAERVELRFVDGLLLSASGSKSL